MFISYWTSYGLRQFLTIAVTVRNLTDFHVSNRCLLPLAPLPACEASACCSRLIIGRGCWWCCLVRWAPPRGGVRTGSDGRGRYLGRWASAWAGRLANSGKCSEPTADGGRTPVVRRPGRAGCEPEPTTSKPLPARYAPWPAIADFKRSSSETRWPRGWCVAPERTAGDGSESGTSAVADGPGAKVRTNHTRIGHVFQIHVYMTAMSVYCASGCYRLPGSRGATTFQHEWLVPRP